MTDFEKNRVHKLEYDSSNPAENVTAEQGMKLLKGTYYEILGVTTDATTEEISSAYRKMVKQYHPDLHLDNPIAAENMRLINRASRL